MAILLNNNGYDNESWRQELTRRLPELPVRVFGELVHPADIRYAMVWNHPAGDLCRYPNLRAIFSLGAGGEHFMGDDSLPEVPIVLLADPAVARDMAAHALYWVATFHRRYEDYRRQQSQKIWDRKKIGPAENFRVGIVGLGRIGTEVARRISDFGYDVSGWDRAERQVENVECYCGPQSLTDFLEINDVIINCLSLSPKTKHLLSYRVFSSMKPGSYFVSISRGAVVDDEALLDALDRGHLAGAALDVFAHEPLPRDHPYWSHSKVNVTPHMSGATFASSAAAVVAENVRKLERGDPVQPLFDRHGA
ncbi:2-hydroxyacid dehydrogenase [Sinorhizobium meliloti]|uniref:2-hydroxyacid dehydrogenase n=1 Tax=Rhizobium meliloti TaxID=382 RepID=UPI001295D25C|nr:glyoxylate/hydroxypyruvate reductase A [Sinorhizobium meliloti]MQU68388.1 glyoxylate/hydroxypyruvate reductase A [Sinorhizobium meliloti]